MNAQQQASNAIQWIDSLPSYKQAELIENRGRLGNQVVGFCCLGAGCEELGIDYLSGAACNKEFAMAVGLIDVDSNFQYKTPTRISASEKEEVFLRRKKIEECTSLMELNDSTEIGFNGISKAMKDNPHHMFHAWVADIIKEHYEIKEQYENKDNE